MKKKIVSLSRYLTFCFFDESTNFKICDIIKANIAYWNITFPWNTKTRKSFLKDYVFRSYHFLEEATFQLRIIAFSQGQIQIFLFKIQSISFRNVGDFRKAGDICGDAPITLSVPCSAQFSVTPVQSNFNCSYKKVD